MQAPSFIQTLSEQLSVLADRIDSAGADTVAQSRFDNRLFQCRGTALGDYLADSRLTLRHLTLAASQGHTEQVAWLAQRLLDQMTALARELATLDMRRRQPAAKAPMDHYARLAEHQDYERRLVNLIRDRESLRQTCDDMSRQQQLQQEIAALEGRLARCRQALARIERQIERLENGFYTG